MCMTNTTDSPFTRTIPEHRTGAPRISGTGVALTPHRYSQDEVVGELTSIVEPGFARFARTSGCEHRSLAMTLDRYPALTGFTEANSTYLEVATDLGEQAVRSALEAAKLRAGSDVDVIVTVSSTGVAVPTIDARISRDSGCGPTSSACRCSGWAASLVPPGWREFTTTSRVPAPCRGAPVGGTVFVDVATRRHLDPALIGVCLSVTARPQSSPVVRIGSTRPEHD